MNFTLSHATNDFSCMHTVYSNATYELYVPFVCCFLKHADTKE